MEKIIALEAHNGLSALLVEMPFGYLLLLNQPQKDCLIMS